MPTQPAPVDPSLPPGAKVGRYRIVQEMGRGGMGIVFRAHDDDLGRDLALKRPLPRLIGDEISVGRFMREARVTAQLKHQHIVPVYEVFNEDGVPWIAMEFVEGRALDDILAKGPRPSLRDAVGYGIQVAEALQAAHRLGVLHRDLKPSNVLVSRQGPALLTDFGLAGIFAAGPAGSTATTVAPPVTTPGTAVGTPGYMSPESIYGQTLDTRSDIFSLGVVLYELTTGRPAFTTDEQGTWVQKVLNHDPAPISALQPAAPGDLERIVLKAMAKQADQRYQDVGELLAELRRVRDDLPQSGRDSLPPTPVPPDDDFTIFGLRPAAAGGLALSMAVAAVLWLLWIGVIPPGSKARPTAETEAASPAPPAPTIPPLVDLPRVGVAPFVDHTGDIDAALRGDMLARLLGADLNEWEGLRAVAGERMEEIVRGLPDGATHVQMISALRRQSACDWIVTGDLYKERQTYELLINLFSETGAEPAETFRVSAGTSTALASLATPRLAGWVAPAGPDRPSGRGSPLAEQPEEALLLLTEGETLIHELRYLDAIRRLEHALELAPRSVAAHAALTRALHGAGYTRRARETASRGLEVARRLGVLDSSREGLVMQAVDAEARSDIEAEEVFRRRLVERYPGDADALLELAEALREQGEAAEALAWIDRAEALDPLSGRILREKAGILQRLRRVDEALAAARVAEARFSDIGSAAGVGASLMTHGFILSQNRDYAAAEQQYASARRQFESAGEPVRAAAAANAVGDTKLMQGDLVAARSLYESALPVARAAGDFVLTVRALSSLGGSYYRVDEYDQAERYFREAVEESRRLGNPRIGSYAVGNLSSILGYTGMHAEARALAQQTLDLGRETGDLEVETFALSLLGDAEFALGRLDEARSSYEEVLRIARTDAGLRTRMSETELRLSGIHTAQGRLDAALASIGQTVAIERELGRKVNLAFALLVRAAIRGAAGLHEEAEQDLQEAGELSSEWGMASGVPLRIGLIRARDALMRGRPDELFQKLDELSADVHGSKTPGTEVEHLLLTCQGHLMADRSQQARTACRSALDHRLALSTEKVSARAGLIQAMLAQGLLHEAADEASVLIAEAGRLGLPGPLAMAAGDLPPGERFEQEALTDLLTAGRQAWQDLLAHVPPQTRTQFEQRADLQAALQRLSE